MDLRDLLPMPPDEGPPLPRVLGVEWPGKEITERKLRELIDQVPDLDAPEVLSYWVQVGDKMVYLEGWSDKCLIGYGFPPIEKGNHEEKIARIEQLTQEMLPRKAKEKGLRLVRGRFVETPDAINLYGVSYGIYQKE